MLGNLVGAIQVLGRLLVAIGSGWVAHRYGDVSSAASVGIGQFAFYFSFYVVRLSLAKLLMLPEVESNLSGACKATVFVAAQPSSPIPGQLVVACGDLVNEPRLDRAARLNKICKLIKARDRQFTDLFFHDMIPVMIAVVGGVIFSEVIRYMPPVELTHLGVTAQSPIVALSQVLIGIMPMLFAVGKLYGEITFLRGQVFELIMD